MSPGARAPSPANPPPAPSVAKFMLIVWDKAVEVIPAVATERSTQFFIGFIGVWFRVLLDAKDSTSSLFRRFGILVKRS